MDSSSAPIVIRSLVLGMIGIFALGLSNPATPGFEAPSTSDSSSLDDAEADSPAVKTSEVAPASTFDQPSSFELRSATVVPVSRVGYVGVNDPVSETGGPKILSAPSASELQPRNEPGVDAGTH
jgi:hypothetical protein